MDMTTQALIDLAVSCGMIRSTAAFLQATPSMQAAILRQIWKYLKG